MKQQGLFSDFIYQVFSLIISLIVVHAVYVAVIRPNSEAVLTQQAAMYEQDSSYVPPQSIYVILKDYEQESCVILTLWAFAILGLKIRRNLIETRLLDRSLLDRSRRNRKDPTNLFATCDSTSPRGTESGNDQVFEGSCASQFEHH